VRIRVILEPERQVVVYTREQVAEMCQVSTDTVDRWRKLGLDSSSPTGGDVRIMHSSLVRFLSGGQ
jgi:hypothetical protein